MTGHISGIAWRTTCRTTLVLLVVVLLTAGWIGSATAEAASPQWTVTAVSGPTNFAPGSESGPDVYVITVVNTGGAATDGSPITVFDELPEGLSVDPKGANGHDERLQFEQASGANMTCALASCTYSGTVVPGDTLTVRIPVDVAGGAPEQVRNVARVLGGGASAASAETVTMITSSPAAFGLAEGGSAVALSSGQAGGHSDLTTLIAFNTLNKEGSLPEDPKNTVDEMPPGFAGDLVDTPACTPSDFLSGSCAPSTQVGVTTLTLAETGIVTGTYVEPVYNLTPRPGDVARVGFSFAKQFYFEGNVTVRPNDYGLQAVFHNASEGIVELDRVTLTVWGIPADPVHDPLRFEPPGPKEAEGHFGASTSSPQVPFLTDPTSCPSAQSAATFSADSWQAPERFVTTTLPIEPFVGCDKLGMEPDLRLEPTTSSASSASGLNFQARIPQTYENAQALATSTLKRIVVKLPEGMTINPSSANGLSACTQAQYAAEVLETPGGRGCPSNSKIGTVTIHSPSLKEEAYGSVFLAQPYENPFGTLLALYVVARIPERGVIVKSAGQVIADPVTGQLTSVFDELPPLPFDTLKLNLKQGPTAPLATPALCGPFSSESQLTPWSEPAGSPLRPLTPPFSITSGPGGAACPSGVLSFAPSLSAGSVDSTAGSFTGMDIEIGRGDGMQEISRLSTQLPPGLTADLVGVPFCSDAAIEASKTRSGAEELASPSCRGASEIGQTLTGAGFGSVLTWVPGKLYFAGPYHGAPFSVVAITPAKVGPYDLGTVVVREALQIDPQTAEVSVDASASDTIPHIIKGIVVHARDIRIRVNRPSFTINPTNCEAKRIAATVVGAGADFTSSGDDDPVTVANPFQVVGCKDLSFQPHFSIAVSGKTSRANGTSLHVALTFPKRPLGSEANVKYIKVTLPKQLPSRLETLNKACLAKTFESNPALCPPASQVGTAKAVTPLLPVPLTGPAYFVSYGNAKFPELVIVLQGYGITIELHGETFISKGVTTSTFRTVPDQPVTSFELTLPAGRYSALGAFGDLCALTKKVTVRRTVTRIAHGRRVHGVVKAEVVQRVGLVMPTQFEGQNGAAIKTNTPVSVTECPKAKPRKKTSRRRKRGKK